MEECLVSVLFFAAFLLRAFQPKNPRAVGLLEVKSLGALPESRPNSYYPSNRPPLTVSPLVKLPIGAVEPRGWLLSQLKLMRDGLTGRLSEISPFLGDESGWLTLKGEGWEEVPYWLRGYGDLGYILKDPRIQKDTELWLSAVFKSQQRDGYFGPPANKAANDLWPNMVMLGVLRSFHEATGDRLVLSFMSRYFQYQFHLPVGSLLPGSWQKFRGGENLESVYWLYNRTGESYLLDLAKRLFDRTSDWTSAILSPERDRDAEDGAFYHGVNIAMGIRQPAVFFQQSKAKSLLEAVEANYRRVMGAYGQQPGGMFGADENIRPGKSDPRQAAEACSIVEFMASFESLLKITGDPVWADRCEEIAFNSLPVTMPPDLRGVRYLTAANLISGDSSGDHDFQNTGTLVSFDPWNYRCCRHNVGMAWPCFAEHLWMATADNGLAAVLYAPSVVTAMLLGSAKVSIAANTDYPFGESVDLTVSTDRPSEFPLYLRIPGWAESARLILNGEELLGPFSGGRFALIRKIWRHGDQVRLEFPMDIKTRIWPAAGNSVSVNRGPLWYSLAIAEKWRKYGGTDTWPAYEVLPSSPWNYALVLNPKEPGRTISVTGRNPVTYQPFQPASAPVVLTARAKRTAAWKAEGKMAGPVPPSPVNAKGKTEKIKLIPMGCARLRIASFPAVKPGLRGGGRPTAPKRKKKS